MSSYENASRDGESAEFAGKLFLSLAVLGGKDDAYTWLVPRGGGGGGDTSIIDRGGDVPLDRV